MPDEQSAAELPRRSAMRDLAEDASSRKRFLRMVGAPVR